MSENSAIPVTRAAIIVAAGVGQRAGGDRPKQHTILGNKTVLQHTFEALRSFAFDRIVIVHAADDALFDMQAFEGAVGVIGGTSRTDSVKAGLSALRDLAPDRVFIHDAARPFVSVRILEELDTSLDAHQASVPTLPIADAVKRVMKGRIEQDLPRADMMCVQTPQAFRYADIMAAYDSVGCAQSDDIAVAVESGLTVGTVMGDPDNFKITYPDDFRRAERLMAWRG